MNIEFKIANALEELKKEGLDDSDAQYWTEQIKSRNLQAYSDCFDDITAGNNLYYFECESKGRKVGYILEYLENDKAKIIGCRFRFQTNALYDTWMKRLKPISQDQLDTYIYEYNHGGSSCLARYLYLVKYGYINGK